MGYVFCEDEEEANNPKADAFLRMPAAQKVKNNEKRGQGDHVRD